MSDIDDLKSLLGDPSNIASLAETLGASEDDTRQAVAAAVPALLGGLAMQADDPERSAGLEQALENDHSGDIFGQLDALLGGTGSGKQFDGAGILGHIFGEQQDDVVQNLSTKTGANGSLVSRLLPILAPIVMGWLAKKMTGGSSASAEASGGSSGGGLSDILGSVLGQSGGGSASGGGGLMDVIGAVLGGGGSSGGNASSGGLGDLLGSILGGK